MPHQHNVFKEVLKYIPQEIFQDFVEHYEGDKWCKQFTCWDLFLTLLEGQLQGCSSLRNLTLSHNFQQNILESLGTTSVARSTLSDACQHRPPALFMTVFHHVLHPLPTSRCVDTRLGHFVQLLDSTPIPLKGHGYEWAKSNHRTKGLKLHTGYDVALKSPVYQLLSAANVNDISAAKAIRIKAKGYYVFDKAYYDYTWWNTISQAGSYFVTRLKKDAPFKRLARREVCAPEVRHDWTIQLRSKAGKRFNGLLRHIRVKLSDHQSIIIITNDLANEASYIAALYKKRWEIELFFKWLKQHLKIKRFWGKSENAVKLQIITALIAYVLLRLIQIQTRSHYTLSQIGLIVRLKLYESTTLDNILTPLAKPPDKSHRSSLHKRNTK